MALLLALIFAGVYPVSYAATCSNQTVSLPLNDVYLPQTGSYSRGVELTVGTPPQQVAVLPRLCCDSLWLYDVDGAGQCGSSFTRQACITLRGGLYNHSASSSSNPGNDPGFGTNDNATISPEQWESDTVHFQPYFDLPQYNIGLKPQGSHISQSDPKGILGLNWSSTFLKSLRDTGQIKSNVFFVFWGLIGNETGPQKNGSLVLGGYDQAKVSGNNLTLNLDRGYSEDCVSNFRATITDLELKFPNGTLTSFLNDQPISTCISLEHNLLLYLPGQPYLQGFEELTKTTNLGSESRYIYYGAMRYNADSVYEGDLVITLNTNLRITVPNHQLVLPSIKVADSGSLFDNTSERILAFHNATSTDSAVLGRMFFSSAYMMVDHDASEATLWAVNPTTNQDLIGIDYTCTNGTTFLILPQPTTSSHKPAGLKSGVIAGVAVAVSALSAIIASAVIYGRRRQSRSQLPPEPTGSGGKKRRRLRIEHLRNVKSVESPAKSIIPEMPGESEPCELPAESKSAEPIVPDTRSNPANNKVFIEVFPGEETKPIEWYR